MSVDELASEVAAREGDGSELSDLHVERVRTSLYHNHLPQLDDSNLVEFDADERSVVLAEERRLEELLDAVFGE